MNDPIAYCGVDCAACHDFTSGKCPGCRKTQWDAGDECMPVACCRERHIAYCGECGEFPCADMADFYKESESHEKAHALMEKIRAQKNL